jgi:hypothetical protein
MGGKDKRCGQREREKKETERKGGGRESGGKERERKRERERGEGERQDNRTREAAKAVGKDDVGKPVALRTREPDRREEVLINDCHVASVPLHCP